FLARVQPETQRTLPRNESAVRKGSPGARRRLLFYRFLRLLGAFLHSVCDAFDALLGTVLCLFGRLFGAMSRLLSSFLGCLARVLRGFVHIGADTLSKPKHAQRENCRQQQRMFRSHDASSFITESPR